MASIKEVYNSNGNSWQFPGVSRFTSNSKAYVLHVGVKKVSGTKASIYLRITSDSSWDMYINNKNQGNITVEIDGSTYTKDITAFGMNGSALNGVNDSGWKLIASKKTVNSSSTLKVTVDFSTVPKIYTNGGVYTLGKLTATPKNPFSNFDDEDEPDPAAIPNIKWGSCYVEYGSVYVSWDLTAAAENNNAEIESSKLQVQIMNGTTVSAETTWKDLDDWTDCIIPDELDISRDAVLNAFTTAGAVIRVNVYAINEDKKSGNTITQNFTIPKPKPDISKFDPTSYIPYADTVDIKWLSSPEDWAPGFAFIIDKIEYNAAGEGTHIVDYTSGASNGTFRIAEKLRAKYGSGFNINYRVRRKSDARWSDYANYTPYYVRDICRISSASPINHNSQLAIEISSNNNNSNRRVQLYVSNNNGTFATAEAVPGFGTVTLDKPSTIYTNMMNNDSSKEYQITLNESAWDWIYRHYGNLNRLKFYLVLQTIGAFYDSSINGYNVYSDDTKEVVCTLNGDQKTTHIGIDNSPRRAQVYIRTSSGIKKAVAWVGVKDPTTGLIVPRRTI